MVRLTEAQKATRRQEILAAALRCFSRDGFHATTIADIVRESGVSQGTFYLYFATKDDVIVALADDRQHGNALVAALVEAEPDPVQGLWLLLELHGRSLADPQRADGWRVTIQGWAEALRNPAIHASIAATSEAVRREIVRLIERGQAGGQFRPDADPGAVAQVLLATFLGLTLQVSLGDDVRFDALGRWMRDLIRRSLFTEAAEAAHHP